MSGPVSEHHAADRRVVAVIESSILFQVLDRSLGQIWRAASGSLAVAAATGLANGWTGVDQRLRRLAVGIMLLVAVAAHLVLTVLTQAPPGWLWLLTPSLFAAIGVILIAASGVPGRQGADGGR